MQFLSPEQMAIFSESGYLVIDQWLSPSLLKNTYQEFDELYRQGYFKKAHVTRGAAVRGDWTFWLQDELPPSLRHIEKELRNWLGFLNQNFYCGVTNLESHLAHYPEGPGYEKHIDQPQGRGHRVITFVLYLNPFWNEADGGELCLYQGSEMIKKISPLGGRLVLFRSDQFPHEVLACRRPRRSLTGWFRNDAVL